MHRMSALGAATLLIASTVPAAAVVNDGTVEDEIAYIVAGESDFGGAALHIPSQGTAMDTSGAVVDGLLVGFVGDYVPLLPGRAEIILTPDDPQCAGERAVLVFDVRAGRVDLVGKRLESDCREVVRWRDPLVSLIEGAQPHWLVELTEPRTRQVGGGDGDGQRTASGPVRHVRVSFLSDPPGSEIWVNDERMDGRTDARLSIPYVADAEDEKRWLIRTEGLVNCYGAFPLPQQEVSVSCRHRQVR